MIIRKKYPYILPVAACLLATWSPLFSCGAFVPLSLSHHAQRRQHTTSTFLEATSSSKLKRGEQGKEASSSSSSSPSSSKRRPSVVHRLTAATARAAAKKKRTIPDLSAAPSPPPLPQPHNPPEPKLASLRQLTQAIDRQLLTDQGRAVASLSGLLPATDSMTELVVHNHRYETKKHDETLLQQPQSHANKRQVAIVLGKSLQQDRITVEYAQRIQRLVAALQEDTFDVICFLGGKSGTNLVADADAGYLYFQHLMATITNINKNHKVHLVRSNLHEGALDQVVDYLEEHCLQEWKKREGTRSNLPPPHGNMSRRRKRVALHISFVSSEDHLCLLHDIHNRSPGQSPLKAFDEFQDQVETTWSYLYTSRRYQQSQVSSLDAFKQNVYSLGQQCVPVVWNLRGVVQHQEFFQRANYRALVAARRALVRDMETIYQQQPSLQAVRLVVPATMTAEQDLVSKPLDVVLEGALLSLGRCLDLVRPAALLSGSVPQGDWKMALHVLEEAVQQILVTTDPDRPLDSYDHNVSFDGGALEEKSAHSLETDHEEEEDDLFASIRVHNDDEDDEEEEVVST